MNKNRISLFVITLFSAFFAGEAQASLTRLVPEHGFSKAFTLKTDSDYEYVVRFYRPDTFRVEAGLKVYEGNGYELMEMKSAKQGWYYDENDFVVDDDPEASKNAKGVWKNIEYIAE